MATKKQMSPEDYRSHLIHQLTHDVEDGKTCNRSHAEIEDALSEMIRTSSRFIGDKATEQVLLSWLISEPTYFGNEFTEDESLQMQSNIRNDFPIFQSTRIGAQTETINNLRSQVDSMGATIGSRNEDIDKLTKVIASMNSRLNTILHNLVCVEISTDSQINACLGQFSRNAIIMEKLNQGIALNAGELEVVKSKITI